VAYKDPVRQREYNKKWIAARRKAFFEDKVCIQCGTSEELELDHIDPAFKIDHRIWSWSQERRQAEIAKCQILCHKCHLVKSLANDIPAYINGFKHGTPSMYQVHKCRCDLCCKWQSDRMKRYRSAKPA
jgi:hypothetical protein